METEKKLARLLKQYDGSKSADFRIDFRDAVTAKRRSSPIAPEFEQRLYALRDVVEKWHSPDAPTAEEALAQLYDLLREFAEPAPLLAHAAAGSFAKKYSAGLNPGAVLLSEADPSLVRVLAEALFKPAKLAKLAGKEPAAVYASPVLDVILEKGAVCPKAMWRYFEGAPPRPAGLVARPEAVARFYAREKAKDADEWVIHILQAEQDSELLSRVIGDVRTALRLCLALVARATAVTGKTQPRKLAAELLRTVESSLAEQAAAEANPGSAAALLGLIRCSSAAGRLPPTNTQLLGTETGSGASTAVAERLLRRAESSTPVADTAIVALTGSELHAVANQYLQRLGTAGSGDQGSDLTRSQSYQQYLGKRALAEALLSALAAPHEDQILPRIEAALFNAGVHKTGEAGAHLEFDVHAHEPIGEAVLPGDTVHVLRPGWQIGTGDAAIVLRKAAVELAEEARQPPEET